jgi:hypothetical protein
VARHRRPRAVAERYSQLKRAAKVAGRLSAITQSERSRTQLMQSPTLVGLEPAGRCQGPRRIERDPPSTPAAAESKRAVPSASEREHILDRPALVCLAHQSKQELRPSAALRTVDPVNLIGEESNQRRASAFDLPCGVIVSAQRREQARGRVSGERIARAV